MPTLGSGSNQIKPFATGVGANVQTPTEWNANTLRQQGFQDGIAPAPEFNTAFRQTTTLATVVAQLMADFSGNATLDDGDVLAAEANLVLALKKLLGPFGVYFINDTGAGNHIVGTSSPAPDSYTTPSLIVFKKSNSDNTGAMDINLWTLGTVTLKDQTGGDFSSAAIKANSFYIASYDGGGYRILGGGITYTSVSNLTANSGDGIQVVSGSGLVNLRTLAGTHDTSVNTLDRISRGRNSDDHAVYMTIAEWIAYWNAHLSFLTTVPPSGFGMNVGQWVTTGGAGGLNTTPASYGYYIGMYASGASLSAGAVPGVGSQQFPFNTSYAGYGWPTGTLQLLEWSFNNNAGFITCWDLRWLRVA